uniref:Uncharacterized protein n=1 Tax=Branchiostoma floridae TaxID=7739 RepID=C3XVR2_BRAFL|eukprot:XP_002611846.1 hypothetical protein BRAFLDRAFT_123360 [Branchiostoma floridae]
MDQLVGNRGCHGDGGLTCVEPLEGEFTHSAYLDAAHEKYFLQKVVDSEISTSGSETAHVVRTQTCSFSEIFGKIRQSTRFLDDLKAKCRHKGLNDEEETTPYAFFVNDREIVSDLQDVVEKEKLGTEQVLDIIYQPQAVFRVRAVTRCTSTIEGHSEAVISVAFSPSGRFLASGSGDTTVRFWDIYTETPKYTCKGHSHWILALAWAPDGRKLASGCKNAQDGTVRIWDVVLGRTLLSLNGHLQSVTCVKWGGEGLIYTASQDRTIKVWRPDDDGNEKLEKKVNDYEVEDDDVDDNDDDDEEEVEDDDKDDDEMEDEDGDDVDDDDEENDDEDEDDVGDDDDEEEGNNDEENV